MSRNRVDVAPDNQFSFAGRWKFFSWTFAALLVPMLLWSLASPLGSIPDEPSHAIRAAAVVRGEIITGAWVGDPSTARADVPAYVAGLTGLTCFAGHPNVTPSCAHAQTTDPDSIVTIGTSSGNNGPLYYAIIGLPTLFLDGDVSLYAMRFVNALLCAAALAVMIMQLKTLPRSRWAIAGSVIAITPMVLFLSGSVNPNAIELASAGALLGTLIAFIRAPGRHLVQAERVVLAVAALGLLVNTRSIALLWVLLIVAGALAFATRKSLHRLARRPSTWSLVALSAAVCVGAIVWYANPTPFAPNASTTQPTGFGSAIVSMAIRTFDFAGGYVGIFGWLDTPSPAFTLIVWSAVVVAMILAAFIWGSGRARLAAAGFGAAMVLVPPVTQAILAPQFGYIWQSRYMLAILLCFLVACGLALDSSFAEAILPAKFRTLAAATIVLLALGQVMSFVWTLRRYIVGLNGALSDMLLRPSWQPPLGWLTLSALMAGWAIAASVLLYRAVVRPTVSTSSAGG